MGDNWQHRSSKMLCETCMWWVPKKSAVYIDPASFDGRPKEVEANRIPRPMLGRCRRYAPTMGGWPAVFDTDWCGNHKLDENKVGG